MGMEIIYENTKDKEMILSTGPLIPTRLTRIIDTKSSLKSDTLYELFIQGKLPSEIQYEKLRLDANEKILEIKGTHTPEAISRAVRGRLAVHSDEQREVLEMRSARPG